MTLVDIVIVSSWFIVVFVVATIRVIKEIKGR